MSYRNSPRLRYGRQPSASVSISLGVNKAPLQTDNTIRNTLKTRAFSMRIAHLILFLPFKRVFICATVRPSGSGGSWNRTSSVFPSMFSVLLIDGVNAGGRAMPVSASVPPPSAAFDFPFFLRYRAGVGQMASTTLLAARLMMWPPHLKSSVSNVIHVICRNAHRIHRCLPV